MGYRYQKAMTWEKEKTAMKDKGGKTPKEAMLKHFELAQFHSLLMDLCEGQEYVPTSGHLQVILLTRNV